jgi:hypothetical protein
MSLSELVFDKTFHALNTLVAENGQQCVTAPLLNIQQSAQSLQKLSTIMHTCTILTTDIIENKIICDMYQNSLYKSKPLSSIRNKIKYCTIM